MRILRDLRKDRLDLGIKIYWRHSFFAFRDTRENSGQHRFTTLWAYFFQERLPSGNNNPCCPKMISVERPSHTDAEIRFYVLNVTRE